MLIIKRESQDPYFNLAAEEYLVKNIEEPCFMLWQNKPSLIIGKHQNPLKEVDLQFAAKENIPIIRRISGGGSVYHDLGNINYSFIDFGKADSLVNFAKYSQPILRVLLSLGVEAKLEGKNDLNIQGRKFSGNASHVYHNKVLHHGTLLYSSDLLILEQSLSINKTNIIDKAIRSNRSEVCNIIDYLEPKLPIEAFKEKIIETIKSLFSNWKELAFSAEQINEINKLAQDKYKSWEWNFGYSPKYSIQNTKSINGKQIHFKISVSKGFIQEIKTNSVLPIELQSAIQLCIGIQHHEQIIEHYLSDSYNNQTINEMISILF